MQKQKLYEYRPLKWLGPANGCAQVCFMIAPSPDATS